MVGWIIFGVYCLGYVLMWRTVVWAVTNDMLFGSRPGGDDIVVGIFLGSLVTLIWPLIFAGLAVRSIYRARGEDATRALMPRSVRREQELNERQKNIERLERELGVGRNG